MKINHNFKSIRYRSSMRAQIHGGKTGHLLCLLIATLLLGLAGCQTPGQIKEMENKDTDASVEVFAARNSVGEKCRVERIVNSKVELSSAEELDVRCGRWEHASGHIYATDSRNQASDLERWMQRGWWKEQLDEKAICEPPVSESILGGIGASLANCKLRNGDWPYLALVASIDGKVYLADGIPAISSVLEKGIGVVSGRVSAGSAETGSTKSRLQRRVDAALKGRIYGAGDIRTYFQLMAAGQYYNSVKDFTTAANRYREALAIHEKALGTGNPGILDPMIHLALEMSNQGRFAEAESLFKGVGGLAGSALDQSDNARYMSYRALHAANQQRFEEALEWARRSTALRRKLVVSGFRAGDGDLRSGALAKQREDVFVIGDMETPNAVDMVQSLYIESAMLDRLGQPEQAASVLADAGAILEHAEEAPPAWEPEVLELNARIAKEKGAAKSRQKSLDEASSLWRQYAPKERPAVINFLELGASHRDAGRLTEALAAFQSAIDLVKAQRSSLNYDQLQPYFQTGFDLAKTQPSKRDRLYAGMFEAGQLVRSEITSQNISLAVARLAAKEDKAGEVIRDFQDTQDQRHVLNRAYEAEVARPPAETNKQKLDELRGKLGEIDARIKELGIQVQAAFPRYNQIVDSVVEVERVKRLMKPNEALVQILHGNDDGIAFAVTEKRTVAVPIDISRSEVARLVKDLRSGLEPTAAGDLPPFNVVLAHQLYQRLFEELFEQIDVSHLITVPSGPLLSLPFGLLVTEPPSEATAAIDYTDVKWLAQKSAVSLLPSVQSFVGLRGVVKSSKASKMMLGFGDFVPYSEGALKKVGANLSIECGSDPQRLDAHRQMLLQLGALPMTKTEITRVAEKFPPSLRDLVFREAFNDKAIKKRKLSDYKILHFATHGLLPTELECQPQPSLVTSLPESKTRKDDGLLDFEEILSLRLDADLVILSACNTGGPGLETGGESLSGLARAFFFAGARSLVVSHWLAEDTAASSLMIDLFQNVRTAPDEGWAEAMRQGQIKLIEEAKNPEFEGRAHPFFWGAFTVVGDGAKGVSELKVPKIKSASATGGK